MHTPECMDGIDWWPEGAPAGIDVSGLPAAGAITNPLRLQGCGKWIGVWGDFAGARISLDSAESWPLPTTSVLPYPNSPDGRTVSIFLSKDTGGNGTLTIARFKTAEAARAWVGMQISFRNSTGGFGPFPGATALADAEANATVSRIGVYPSVFSDRQSLWDRFRQPDSFVGASTMNAALAITGAGVKSTVTLAQAGWVDDASITVTTLINSVTQPVVQLRLTRAAVTSILGLASLANNAPVGQVYNLGRLLAPVAGGAAGTNDRVQFPFQVASGDVVDLNLSVVAGTAGACDFRIGTRRERFAF